MDEWPEGPKGMLCFALYASTHAMQRLYKPLLNKLGLTYSQYLVLMALWEKDEQLVGELGRTLYLESNTLTPLIKRLEGMGYVTRQRDAQDERKVRVQLSQDGHALRSQGKCIPQELLVQLGLSKAQALEYERTVDDLRERLMAALIR